MPDQSDPHSIGGRIRKYRTDAGLSLNKLAELSGVSKGYLSSLENRGVDSQRQRPSGDTLYAIANALGVTMSDLLGRKLIMESDIVIDPSLQEFAISAGLPESDVHMLATIQWRGETPRSVERWRYIYQAITTSQSLDATKPSNKRTSEKKQPRSTGEPKSRRRH